MFITQVVYVCVCVLHGGTFSGDATEITLRDLKPSADYYLKYVCCSAVFVVFFFGLLILAIVLK